MWQWCTRLVVGPDWVTTYRHSIVVFNEYYVHVYIDVRVTHKLINCRADIVVITCHCNDSYDDYTILI